MRLTNIVSANYDVSELAYQIRLLFQDTRFSLEISNTYTVITLDKIRLKSSKEYCGNHPEACALAERTHRKMVYLEGADWVEFNDTLNNFLDEHDVSANVGQSVVIRKGYSRCIEYLSKRIGAPNAIWERLGVYENYSKHSGRGQAPVSIFPPETPGIYEKIGYNVVG